MHSSNLIEWMFVGTAKPLSRKGHPPVPSGIVKQPTDGRLRLSFNGLEGDEQGDTTFHGGPEKAVHHYPSEHYALWRARLPACAVPFVPGAVGENIGTSGMTEQTVCIGDVYRLGSALVQVSQGRQPCWKLNRHLQYQDAALTMQTLGATGWYYRVLREGFVTLGDVIELAERPCPEWPMRRLIEALFPRRLVVPDMLEEWREAAALEQLSSNWRNTFARRVSSQQIEDWTKRLYEPHV